MIAVSIERRSCWRLGKDLERKGQSAIWRMGTLSRQEGISTGEICICIRAVCSQAVSGVCLDTCLVAKCHQWILARPIRLCQCRSDQEERHRDPIAGPLQMHVTLMEIVGSWCGWRAHWSPFQADRLGFYNCGDVPWLSFSPDIVTRKRVSWTKGPRAVGCAQLL